MKQTLWLTLALMLLAALWPTTALAQSPPPMLEVEAGLDGYCSTDAGEAGAPWCPIHITISNEGENVEGMLNITPDEEGKNVPYSVPVVLPTHSRKGYFLYLPSHFPDTSPRLRVSLETDNGSVPFHRLVTLNVLSESDSLYGVISDRSSAFNFLSGIYPTGKEVSVAHLDPATLPPNPLGWECLDVLILNDSDTTRFDADRRAALETWVSHGGHLIVGGGAGAARTVAGVTDLLPVSVNGVREVDNLNALAQIGVGTVDSGPYPVATSTLLEDGKVLIEQDGLILVARRPYGDGYVDFLAFDAGLNPFTWDDIAVTWRWLLNVDVPDGHIRISSWYPAQDAVRAIPGIKLPSTFQIIAFLFLYIIVIGPLNYLILRRLGRLERAWWTIPAVIFVFSACAYLTGFQIRGTKPVLNQMAVVYLPTDGHMARVSAMVGLFSPYRTNYDVRWETNAVSAPDDFGYGNYKTKFRRVLAEGETTAFQRVEADIGGVNSFLGERYIPLETSATVDLHLTIGTTGTLGLEGTVRNGETPLRNAVLLVNNQVQRLGTLEAGDEAKVYIPYSFTDGIGSWNDLQVKIMGKSRYWDDPEAARRYDFLGAIFQYSNPSILRSNWAYLIGWGEESPLPVEIADKQAIHHNLTLYIYELALPPLRPDEEESDTVVLTPELITCSEVWSEGDVESSPREYLLGPAAELHLRCVLPFQLTIGEVDRMVLEMDGYPIQQPPEVYFWDAEADEWVNIGADWGETVIANGERYLENGRSILVKLKTGEKNTDVRSLMFTIEGRQ